MPGHGEVVDEGRAPAGRMSLVSPIAVLEDGGAEKIDLNHLTCHAIDLYPVTDAHSVLAHENEPAEERENEALQSYCKAGGGEAQDGRDLAGYAERHQQHAQDANQLHTEPQDGMQRLHAPPVKCDAMQA